ncbi:unnamed protein product [Cochlearia groenlandica]
MKKVKQHLNMLMYVADGQYEIPTCTLSMWGTNHSGCHSNFKNDGLHYRQPLVFGVEEEIQKLKMEGNDMDGGE